MNFLKPTTTGKTQAKAGEYDDTRTFGIESFAKLNQYALYNPASYRYDMCVSVAMHTYK